MPICFQLTLKGQDKPSLLSDVDEAICKHLGVEVHPVRYVEGWFDTIGLSLACGKDWAWLREKYQGYQADYPDEDYSTALKIIDYLEANYTVSTWAAR